MDIMFLAGSVNETSPLNTVWITENLISKSARVFAVC